MKKQLLWLSALALSLAACTTEPAPSITDGDENKGTTETTTSQLVQLKVDANRFQVAPGTRDEEAENNNGAWILAPDHLTQLNGESASLSHVYSATGIAFDGTTVYISWHSNRAQDLDEDSDEHNHGTNVGEDGSEPSLADADDWGGMVDVLDFSNFETAAFKSSYWQPEHKYNHVLYNGGKLYLASTSYMVGAALHVIPTTAEGLNTNNAAERFTLTGNSANCVALLDNEVITISGRKQGGVNWFDPTEADAAFTAGDEEAYNYSETNINEETADFGGKHIYVDGSTVYALRNPEAPVIEIYTKEGATEFIKLEDYKLEPIDGKNVLAGDENYFYVCCGKYGLHVYDKSTKEEVASSFKNIADNKNATLSQKYYAANGVDVDENYIYVANGAGLVIFEKNFDKLNPNNGLTVKKYAQFTGTIDFSGLGEATGNEKTEDGLVKESSNFVKLYTVNDKHYAFVAYGMYGLRIYDLSELYPATEE